VDTRADGRANEPYPPSGSRQAPSLSRSFEDSHHSRNSLLWGDPTLLRDFFLGLAFVAVVASVALYDRVFCWLAGVGAVKVNGVTIF
jgi:hypothetical protein